MKRGEPNMTNKKFKEIGSMLSSQATEALAKKVEDEINTPDPSKEAWEKMLAEEAELKEKDEEARAEKNRQMAEKMERLSRKLGRE
tara:strand:- start:161 stop:418 length:258 start_codon:yes stop_codon:yes gene_type:complete